MPPIPVYDTANVPQVWKPKEGAHSETENFGKLISQKYNVKIENYWDLHKWSVENLAAFWAEMWTYARIIHTKTYDQVVDENLGIGEMPNWFEGARLNYAENLMRYRDDKNALILSGEERSIKYVTYSEMYKEACKYYAALKKLGLQPGDRVACYMSNREEAVYAMLGATAAGATWMATLPLFGAKAVVNRFEQTDPKFLFTIDRFVYQGEEKEMLSKLAEISNALPSLEKIIVIPSKPASLEKDLSGIKNSCFLHEFLSYALRPDGSIPEMYFEQLSFSHPVHISYTSGTTGAPKAIVHGNGVLLNTIRNYGLHVNGTRDDIYLSTSPPGWASWNMFVSILSLGSCLVLYEGMPFFLSPTYIWDLIDELKITNLLFTSAALTDLEKKNYLPSKTNSLSSLKLIIGSSSVIKPSAFDFVYNKIKQDVMFSSFYAQTESMGYSMVADCMLPIHRGEISTPALGVSIRALDEEGNAVEGEVGDLVFTEPSPCLPIGMWGDKDGKLFRDTYFNKFPGLFRIGDICLINPHTKGTVVYGRSDETLKPGGARFGSSEIYHIVEKFPEIQDSLCVSQYNRQRDERAVLFLKMSKGNRLTKKLISKIRKTIENELSKRHVPEIILETEHVPYNMNGKKMESIVKKIINNMPYNSETVINPEALKIYLAIPQLKNFK